MKVTPLQNEIVGLIQDGHDTLEKLVATGRNQVSVSITLNNLAMKGVIGYDTPFRVISTDFEVDTSPRHSQTGRNKPVSKPEPIHAHVAKARKCLQCREEFKSEWKGNRVCGKCKETDVWIGAVPAYDMPQRRAG